MTHSAHRPWRPLVLLAAATALFAPAAVIHAADTGITVIGAGEAKARPGQAEINLLVVGDAEIVNDALVKYRDAKRRSLESLKNLQIENMTVEELGIGLNSPQTQQQMAQWLGGGMGNPAVKNTFRVGERLRLVLRELEKAPPAQVADTVSRIIDATRDT